MAQKDMNLTRLAGTVISNGKGGFGLSITEVNRNGNEFVTELQIAGSLPKGLKKGDRVEVWAQFLQGDDKITRLVPVKIEAATGGDLNAAKIIGRAARPFEYFDGSRGNPFGNLLLRVGTQFVRGVAFGFLAQRLDRSCTRDSRVQLYGRVQQREFTRSDTGEKASILEIVASPDQTRVLEMAKPVDAFENADELGAVEAESIPGSSLTPATAENPL
jgi:hypothetical protein